MKYTPPSNDKHATHVEYFKATYQHRRSVIKTSLMTITSIIEEYPRFKDMPDLVRFMQAPIYRYVRLVYRPV